MFADAVAKVSEFTRPVNSIVRHYNSTSVTGFSSTIFFVNEIGVAITARHVAEGIEKRKQCNERYKDYLKEARSQKNKKNPQKMRALEAKYNYTGKNASTIIQSKTRFIDCFAEPLPGFSVIHHPDYDLSIIVFENFSNRLYKSYARFIKDIQILKPGRTLCRLGYPFAQFSNFCYNESLDDIEWTRSGLINSQYYPYEGMITRYIHDVRTYGFELSTPNLKGHSGSPVFNAKGMVCGMAFGTALLKYEYEFSNSSTGETREDTINNHPNFLYAGHCIDARVIKNFLRENKIKFYEA